MTENGITLTTNKHFKDIVRARMTETGEPYSVAARESRSSLVFRLSQMTDSGFASPAAHHSEMFVQPRPGHPNLSCAVGVSEEGELVYWREGRNVPIGLLIGGRSGSGKTELMLSILRQLTHNNTPEDLQIWGISCKGEVVADDPDIRIDRYVGSPSEGFLDAALRLLRDAFDSMNSRSHHLVEDRHHPLVPLVVVIEEVAALLSNPRNDEEAEQQEETHLILREIMRKGRSLRVSLIMDSQYVGAAGVLDDMGGAMHNMDHVSFRTSTQDQSVYLAREPGMESAPNGVGSLRQMEASRTVLFHALDSRP